MLLVGVENQNAWLISRWKLTYPVGWEQICKAVYSVYDYYNGAEVLVDNKKAIVQNKNDIISLSESGTMTIRGISKIVGVPIMITFVNQTNIVDVNVAKATEEFQNADYESFNKSLCVYMDSIELAMYRS